MRAKTDAKPKRRARRPGGVAAKPKGGRPSTYSESVADDVCERIADGESLLAVCAAIGAPRSTVREWIAANPDFSRRYALAREIRADDIFDDMERIARDVLAGKLDPNAARVAADIHKWRLARMHRKFTEASAPEAGTAIVTKTYAVRDASPDAWDDPPAN